MSAAVARRKAHEKEGGQHASKEGGEDEIGEADGSNLLRLRGTEDDLPPEQHPTDRSQWVEALREVQGSCPRPSLATLREQHYPRVGGAFEESQAEGEQIEAQEQGAKILRAARCRARPEEQSTSADESETSAHACLVAEAPRHESGRQASEEVSKIKCRLDE